MEFRKGYIERAIEQLSSALSAILSSREKGQLPQAERQIRDASLSLLGLEYGVLTSVDAVSAAHLLGKATRIEVLAKLVEQAAEVARDKGDLASWRRDIEYAVQLYQAAIRMESNPQWTESVKALRQQIES